MSVVTELKSPGNPVHETRKILGPGGNRVRVSPESNEATKAKVKEKEKKHQIISLSSDTKPQKNQATVVRRMVKIPSDVAVRKNASVDSTCSSDSSSSGGGSLGSKRRVRVNTGVKSVKVVNPGVEAAAAVPGLIKRCDWITPHSELPYISFHDEEWGVPVHDDTQLFELLSLSIALAEHTWPSILYKREMFRKLFDNFNPESVANFSEEKLLSLIMHGNSLLSEAKLRAIVENARLVLKVQKEFGSFSNYIWRFVNNKPIKNGYRYARQVPVKSPKAEFISKDLMRRGFRCVGPTVIYSFMQVAGLVNDHLITCFRYQECNDNAKKDIDAEGTEAKLTKALEKTYLSHD